MTRPARRPMLRAETRRALAIIAVLVWIFGFEIGPGIHVALHEVWGAHAHEGDRGAVHRGDDHDHDHVHDHAHGHGHAHRHAHPHERAIGRGDAGTGAHDDDIHGDARQPGIDRGDHGRHSLAHRGVAVRTPPPAMPVVSSAPWVDAQHRDHYAAPIRSRRPSATRARGPPALAIDV